MSFSGILLLAAKLFWFFLPAGVANMSPVLVKDHLKFLAIPVDGGLKIGGKPLFGSHKTWRGMIVATIAGGLFYFAQYMLAVLSPTLIEWSPFDITAAPFWIGFLLAAGAITGDLVKSFFKRRISVAPGKSWFPFDQIDFLVGALIVAAIFFPVDWVMAIMVILIGPLFHILVNHLGYWLKFKDSAW